MGVTVRITAEMEPGFRITKFSWVGSQVSVSDPVFDPVEF